MVHPLTDKLKRRLGTVLFLFRHVKVIDENDKSVARRGAGNTLSSLLKLLVNSVLGLIG